MQNNALERLNRLYNRVLQKGANLLFYPITKTSQINTNPEAETVLYCALDRTSCRQYITAAKSFLRYYPNVAVIAQNDGSLGKRNIAEIKAHLPGAIVWSKQSMFEDIQNRATPELLRLIPGADQYESYTSIKIMYLKFLNVIFRLNGKKVIVIDSDIVFLKRPDFIIEWACTPYSHDFYSEGSNDKADIYRAIGFQFTSIDVGNFSSGTIGIGGHIHQDELLEIFSKINNYDAALFYSWELEQALWSIVLAKRDNPVNIDGLREVYVGSGWRSYKELKEMAVIAHFAGAVRFNGMKYLRCMMDVIRSLNRE